MTITKEPHCASTGKNPENFPWNFNDGFREDDPGEYD